MRIVHVLSGLEVGGKERVALRLATAARAGGMDARLLLFDSDHRGEPLDLDPGELPTRFLQRGPGLDLRFAWRLSCWLQREGIEIVHAHNDTAIFYACVAARLLGRRGPAVCATMHVRPGHDTRAGRRLTGWAARRADQLTAVSEGLARFLVESGWLPRCEVVDNGVDLEEFTPRGRRDGWRARLSVPDGALLVAHVGRFDPVKRQEDLLEVARRTRRDEPRLVYVLVGQGPTRDALRESSRDLDTVRFVPRVVDVAAFLREVDLFVLCSDEEGAPLALLEAMASARPIVATAVGGIPRLLEDGGAGTCGRLVPARAPQRLADELLALARDPGARSELGLRARRRAEAFSVEREWARWSQLYRSALAARRGQER